MDNIDFNKKRVIVAGNRRFNNHSLITKALESIIGNRDVVIVSGGATGVDTIASQWANKKGLDSVIMKADWNLHGRAAGPIRNKAMAEISTHLIAFHNGSSGTQNMIDTAKNRGIKVKIIKI